MFRKFTPLLAAAALTSALTPAAIAKVPPGVRAQRATIAEVKDTYNVPGAQAQTATRIKATCSTRLTATRYRCKWQMTDSIFGDFYYGRADVKLLKFGATARLFAIRCQPNLDSAAPDLACQLH